MPTDFTAYTDPGIYIEMLDPPVNNGSAISPTVVALVGSSDSAGKEIVESFVFNSQSSSTLSAKGLNPSNLYVRDPWTLEQYTSAVMGTVRTSVSSGSTIFVDRKDEDFDLTTGTFNSTYNAKLKIKIGNQTFTVTNITDDTAGYVLAVSPAVSAAIDTGASVNIVAPYFGNVPVATLNFINSSNVSGQSPLNNVQTQFNVEQDLYKIQKVRFEATAASSAVTISHNHSNNDFDFSVSFSREATASTIAEAIKTQIDLSSEDELIWVKRSEVIENSTAYVDYTIVLGFDSPSLLTTNNTALTTVIPTGITEGDLLRIENERVLVQGKLVLSTSGNEGNIQILQLDVARGRDGTLATSHALTDVYLTSGYDYYVVNQAGNNIELNGIDDYTVISGVPGGRLAPLNASNLVEHFSNTLEVKGYSTDAKQYSAEAFTDLDDIRTKYGKPIAGNNTSQDPLRINSNITLAAQLALRNGASRVYCVSTASNDIEGFSDAIDKLEGIDEINVVVPVLTGLSVAEASQVLAKVRQFCSTQASAGNLLRSFIGLDGTATANPIPASTFASLSQGTSDYRISLIGPSRFTLQTANGNMTVGGEFAAAAVAGLHASLEVQVPLTRKQIEYSLIAINDPFSASEMLDLQSKGVLVLFQDRTGRLTVKHGLTTDMTNVYTQEISVVASRDRLRDLFYDSLLGAGILGSPITANTQQLVVANVTGALESAKRATLIFDYADVKYRIPNNNPTAIEVRFAYRPTMPLNYVLVQFSVDTTSSSVTFQTATEGGV